MERHSTPHKPGAIALGAFFASITGYVLFKDVIDGAPINTGHALSLAALVAALASLHMAWPQLRAGAIPTGVMLVFIGLASTTYVLVSSGSRNAETAQAKAAVLEAGNEARQHELATLARAEAKLDKARADKGRECASGRGPVCRGLEGAVKAYEESVAAAKVAIKAAGPEIRVNGGYAQTARVIAAIPFVSASEAVIETKLELLLPFVVVLIVEMATVVFLHIGIGTAQKAPVPAVPSVPKVELVPVAPAEPANDDGPDGGTRGEVVSWVREFRARHGRNPHIPELQAVFETVPKTTAWRRIKTA